MKIKTISNYLDKLLKIQDFNDVSNNGLQVSNTGDITGIACGVDASLEFFEAAKNMGANMLVCHHGISWGDSLKTITGLNYRYISYLINNNMALYAAHLPLDAHPVYGNNAQICRQLNLQKVKSFGEYNGIEIGFAGTLKSATNYAAFKRKVEKIMNNKLQTMDFGKKKIRTVAVVSGGAAAEIAEAGMKGFDVYISGEPILLAYNLAKEYGINAIFAGHYATETFGVKALAKLLSGKFKINTDFIDFGITY